MCANGDILRPRGTLSTEAEVSTLLDMPTWHHREKFPSRHDTTALHALALEPAHWWDIPSASVQPI